MRKGQRRNAESLVERSVALRDGDVDEDDIRKLIGETIKVRCNSLTCLPCRERRIQKNGEFQ